MKSLITFCCLLAVPASLQSESCSVPGISLSDEGRSFKVCSRNSDGTYSVSQGSCDEGAVFSLQDRVCLPVLQRRSYSFDEAGCYKQGYTCADCQTLNFCMDYGKGYKVVMSRKCADDEFCSAYSNSCTNSTIVPQCTDGYRFVCNWMGLFPDPYNCGTYYFCQGTGSVPVTMTCPSGNYYSAQYMECLPYQRNVAAPCPPLEECTQDNTFKALTSNPNIYYLCIRTGPNSFGTSVFRCPRGGTFNGSTCVSTHI